MVTKKEIKQALSESQKLRKILVPSLAAVCMVIIAGLIFFNIPVPSETHNYTGTLISYEPHDLLHGGYLSSTTVLHFNDGTSFSVNGAGVYAIGSRYTITYEQSGSFKKVMLVTDTSSSMPSNSEIAYHIIIKFHSMIDITIRICHDPHVIGTDVWYLINSNNLEIQTEEVYNITSKIFVAFYWNSNSTMVNSFQMNVAPSYVFQYNQTSNMVEVGLS